LSMIHITAMRTKAGFKQTT